MKKVLPLIVLLSVSLLTYSQDALTYWKNTVKNSNALVLENKANIQEPKLFSLDISALRNALTNVSARATKNKNEVIVSFPDVDGNMLRYSVLENSTMVPELQAQYPDIRSYVGQGIDNPASLIYFSVAPSGVQTMLINADKEAEFIEPYTKDNSSYIVYRKSDKSASLNAFECKVISTVTQGDLTARPNADDGTLRTYRLALSVTGEYTVFFGGTQALALAAMNASMTRVNGVFEIDFNVHMNLIANENAIIYTNAATDPYSPASTGANGAWNSELQTNLTNTIGNANYDIGHLFGASGGGGNAGCIGCVCVAGTKGSGFTSPADAIPQGDNFDIDYVAHEMGHQFGGNHTFTQSNEGTGVQMEPGSGSTIMGYAGITSLDVQPHSDAYFHAISIEQVTNYIKSTACQTNTATGNAIPTASAGLDYTIPKTTPFMLTGTGTDANGGDVLTFDWEEMDNGSSSAAPSATKTTGPNFRSYNPSTSPTRYFPKLSSTIAGSTTTAGSELIVEALSSVARTLNFRLTVRDNHAGGPANNSDDMIITVNATAGPFIVTAPNTNVIWPGGSSQTVTWNVAGTTANGVNTANVDILLSTDGGNTFPITLLSATPNDGSQAITVPNNFGTTNRIIVKGSGHIFFDMSDVNFRITDPNGGLTSISTNVLASSSFCPGDAVSVGFTTDGVAQAGNVFTAQLSSSLGNFGAAVNIGTLNSTTQGTISATIPANTAGGSGYRIRVISSNPSITGTDNGSNLTVLSIPATPSVTPAGPVSTCSSTTLSYSQVGGAAYQWRKNGVAIAGQTGASLSANTSGTYDVIGGLSQTYSSSTATAIPDNICTGGLSTIAVAGYTGTVSSTGISIKINITHTWVGDLVLVLQAPNGAILGLSNQTGNANNSGDNFTNTIFSDAGLTVIPTTGAPYTGTYKPVAATFTSAAPLSCVTTTITSFAAIGGGTINPNGNWILKAYDQAGQDVGTITNWTITFPATANAPCITTSNAVTVNVNSVDDGNACTTDACNTSTGNATHTPVNVNDNNVCTTDACNTSTGVITHTNISVDDGNACTNDGCNSITGVFHTPVNVDDLNACTTDACDSQTGNISHTPVSTDDGNQCTNDGCNSITGVFHTPVITEDGNLCTVDGCDPSTGEYHTPVNSDDGNVCTTDGCDSATGVYHDPISTDDGDACTTDGCDSTTGVYHTPVNTDDNNACTTDGCDSSTGIYHTTISTNDGNECTIDGCDPSSGVYHNPVNTDDGDACTTDGCDSSTGVFHNPVNTDDGNDCTTDGCDSITGVFHDGLSADDGNPCTTDGCNTIIGVFHNPVNTDDGNACTTDGCDTSTGVFHDPVNTDDGDACTTDACDPSSGNISHTPVNVNDNDACTTDGCDSSTGVYHNPVNTDDGDACTTDGCDPSSGVYHNPVSTDDGNACTTDGCDPSSGVYHNAVSTDDNNACTSDGCDPSSGVYHNPVSTDDGNACTTDGCDPSSGVYHNAVSTDDGNACTTDGCDPSSGVYHNAVSTDDNNACTTDACDTQSGSVTHTNVSTDDGNACTTDACDTQSGAITHTNVSTDDGNACTTDACDTQSGSITHTNVSTDDSNACTTDACDPATGVITHTNVPVDDNNPCTADACDPATGNISHTPLPCGVEVYSNIFLEAYYIGGGAMSHPLFTNSISSNPLHSDLITISAMEATPPYNVVDTQTDTLYTNGNVHVKFGPSVIAGNSYFLKASHRNHVTTWSAAPVVLSSVTTYSFSDAANKAFGDNQTPTHEIPGLFPVNDGFGFAFYCGDIWDGGTPDSGSQDGSVDATDFLDLDPHVQNGDGGYIVSDLNGDGSVDATDFLWLDPNVQNGIGSTQP